MELIEAIRTRRSIRRFKDEQIPEQTIRELLELAIWAPNGMNRQPWVFAVVQDREFLQRLSEQAKASLLERVEALPVLERYSRLMANPKFNVFYNAPTLVLIYGDTGALTFRYDCSLAAHNLMLAAWDRGIGSCWIGFAHFVCDTPELKEEFNVPKDHELVASIILGYPETVPSKGKRREPHIVSWKK